MAPALSPAGERRGDLRGAARIEVGLRRFLEAGGFGAFTDTFEDLDGLEQLPGIARPAADGRWLRLRRRGRLEDRRAGADLKVMGDGPAGGTSFMEDYTYHLGDPVPGARRAHAGGLPVDRDGTPTCEIHPLSIGGKDDPVRLVFDGRARARPSSSALVDIGDRFRLIVNEVDVVTPTRPCRSSRSPAPSGGHGPT